MNEFERAYDGMGLEVEVEKNKMLVVKKDQRGSCEKVRVSGEEMQEVDQFNNLGGMISTDGGMGKKVTHRVLEGRKFWETVPKMWKENMMPNEMKRESYERVVIPTVAFSSQM